MYSACTVWLISPASAEFTALAEAIEAAGGQAHPLTPTECGQWRERVSADQYRGPLPNLLFLDAELAYGHSDGHLEALLSEPPWMFLPLVVIARQGEDEGRARAYTEGAAAWITMPAEAGAQADYLTHIARYWVKTAVLPEITLPL